MYDNSAVILEGISHNSALLTSVIAVVFWEDNVLSADIFAFGGFFGDNTILYRVFGWVSAI